MGAPLRLDESLRRWDLTAERDLQEVLREHVAPGDIVYDVGANFGLHTLYAGSLAGPGGKVFAFEPIPKNLQLLRRNVRLNRFEDRVSIIPAALSNSTESHLAMEMPEDGIAVTASISTGRGLRVANSRLDDLPHPPPRLMKIDVEGAELEVLRGGEKMLREAHPLLIIEIHGYALPAFGASAAEVTAFLAALGYREQVLGSCETGGREYYQALYS